MPLDGFAKVGSAGNAQVHKLPSTRYVNDRESMLRE